MLEEKVCNQTTYAQHGSEPLRKITPEAYPTLFETAYAQNLATAYALIRDDERSRDYPKKQKELNDLARVIIQESRGLVFDICPREVGNDLIGSIFAKVLSKYHPLIDNTPRIFSHFLGSVTRTEFWTYSRRKSRVRLYSAQEVEIFRQIQGMYSDNEALDVSDIKQAFSLPRTKAFRYLCLLHAHVPLDHQDVPSHFHVDTEEQSRRYTGEIAEEITYLLGRLPAHQQKVVQMRFGLGQWAEKPQTLNEISQCIGVTNERVRQIESSALKNLRILIKNPQHKLRRTQALTRRKLTEK